MMDRYKIILSAIFFLLPLSTVLAQDDTSVSGQVLDAGSGETLPGVNIILKGTDSGTTSDTNGEFEMNVSSLNDTLVFSFVGYESQEIPIDGQTELEVEMGRDVVEAEEVVVVGYGEQRKETNTGSVSAISGENLEKTPSMNTSNNISGRIPGVVTQTQSGEPGADGSTIRIRGNNTLGNNDALVVIDGVPNRSGGLERLNPRDIENISVLKDASAAIYGSQAANGVILVTTKRGTDGKPQFNLDVNQGINQPTRIPEMADAPTYLTMRNEIDQYNDREPTFSQDRIDAHRSGEDPWLYPDTDWFDAVLKPVSYQTKADMSVSGGSENIQYYLSLGGLTEDGFYENSATRYNQYNFRSNIDGQVSDHISLGFDISGRLEDRNFPTRSAAAIFRATMRGKPHLPAYWPNGQPGPDIEYGDNPVIIGTDETGYDDQKDYILQSNLNLDIEIPWIDGLGVRGNFSFDKNFNNRKLWQTPWTLYSLDEDTYEETGEPELEGAQRGYSEPQLFQESEEGQSILMNLVTEYQQDLENHSYSVLLGTEMQTFEENFMNSFRRYFISDQIPELFAGGEEERDNDGSGLEGGRMNYFSRINYDYQDKYLVELVGRYDGSYIFPEEKRFGFFPSISLGWRISEEPFFAENVPFFNDLKIRGSYGQTGNDRIDEWQYLETFGFGDGYVFEDTEQTSIYPTRIPNPDVTWEVANQFDIGLEGETLDNRLSFEVDYFNYLRSDILWWRNASIPQTAGFSLPRENIGEVSNRGFDAQVNYRQDIGADFIVDITANAGYAKNKIEYWDEAQGIPEWQETEGYPMPDDPENPPLYYNAIGVFEDEEDLDEYPHWEDARPGDIIFEDVDGDGDIDGDDRIRIDQNNTPTFTGGLNIDVAFKQFDLSVLMQGAAGGVQYVFTESGEIGNYLQDFAEKRWTPDNPNSEHPRAYNRTDEYWAREQNTYWLRDNDYIRLKNLEIGYNLPADVSDRLGLERMRMYVNGFNLLTFDKLKVMDPEAGAGSGQYYPQKRVFNAGLSVTF